MKKDQNKYSTKKKTLYNLIYGMKIPDDIDITDNEFNHIRYTPFTPITFPIFLEYFVYCSEPLNKINEHHTFIYDREISVFEQLLYVNITCWVTHSMNITVNSSLIYDAITNKSYAKITDQYNLSLSQDSFDMADNGPHRKDLNNVCFKLTGLDLKPKIHFILKEEDI